MLLVILAPMAAIVALALQQYILAIILIVLGSLRFNPTLLRAGVLCYKAPRPKKTMIETMQSFPEGEPVGKGWGFFLQKRSPRNPVLMHNLTGQLDGYWLAGTSLETVIRHYKTKGLVFPSHPSYTGISIGSAYACTNHGSGVNTGFRSTARTYATTQGYSSTPKGTIIGVAIDETKLIPNRDLQQSAKTLDSDDDWDWWLGSCVLRVCFFGHAAPPIGIKWTDGPSVTHRNPHCCSRRSRYLQADLCSVVGGCREPVRKWRATESYYEANRFVPTISLEATLIASFYCNYECIIETTDKQLVKTLARALYRVHRVIGGRTEVRFSGDVLFLDVSTRKKHVKRVLNIVKKFTPYKLHTGKYN